MTPTCGFFFNDTATTEIYTLSLHDALPIWLVETRFWLPRRQEIEIRRTGAWMDYPVRGIIRGRWEIGDYKVNEGLPGTFFRGPEIVQALPSEQRRYPWTGQVLDSLPPDVRAVTDAD